MNDDNTVTLTYENGEICSSDNSKKWKTVIKFICEHKKKVISTSFISLFSPFLAPKARLESVLTARTILVPITFHPRKI